ncbi:MAG: hypothetical protein GX799_08495 [Crenarchaeota archaeon]|nr:hypothetical protein [Thermoproteota archaeon]
MESNNLQELRQIEFEKILSSVQSDTPLLLFPLRIETHFRRSKVVPKQENSLINILLMFKSLLNELLQRKFNKDVNYLPFVMQIKEAIEVAELLSDKDFVDIFYLTKDIFRTFLFPIAYPKYSKDPIILALSKAATNPEVAEAFINAGGYKLKGMKVYQELSYFQRKKSAVIDINHSSPKAHATHSQSGSDPSSFSSQKINFPGANNLFNFTGIKAYEYLFLIEKWISEIEENQNPNTMKNTQHAQKELCVRIFPDEIFLDYLNEKLSEQEIIDAKHFWLQWFIASGSKHREYEAWQVLCSKYPIHRAAWLCRQLKPNNISDFKADGPLYYRRPYQNLEAIDSACENIYRHLADITLDESLHKSYQSGEYLIEKAIRIHLGNIKNDLFLINREVMSCEYIVDYLFDHIHTTLAYLTQRLDTFMAFYRKFPGLYGDNLRAMELWDVDYTILKNLSVEVAEFQTKLTSKRISLNDMMQKYLDEEIHDIFPKVPLNRADHPSFPVSNILPDRFMLIGEIKGKENEKITHFGRKVKKNLQLGIDPNEDLDSEPYKINQQGDLEINGGIAWMVDYTKAEESGLAITVPIDDSVNEFNYIYVLGVKQTDANDQSYLHSLFNSHNYSTVGLETLKTGIPTNIITEGANFYGVEPEIEMKRRYEIEVEEIYKNKNNALFDSKKISDALGLNYDECWGRLASFDNKELDNAEKAYQVLWTHFRKYIDIDDSEINGLLDFIGDFLVAHVKARGVLPSLKIGDHPYGLLPVSDFLKLNENLKKDSHPLMRELNHLLVSLANKWKDLRNEKVIHAENLKGRHKEQMYLEMLGQTPHSIEFFERSLIDSPLLPQKDVQVPDYIQAFEDYGLFTPWPVDDVVRNVPLTELSTIVQKQLPHLNTKECELLVSEFLDLFTHRIDAWFTGILDYLISSQTNANKHNTPLIGAFGWVFNLKENTREEIDNREQIINLMQLDQRNGQEEIRLVKNAGYNKGEYIIAPTLQHAISAAILRSAYLSSKKDANYSHMCVNLSSMRARQALRMISGVQAGLSTSSILGADLERYLHEAYKQGAEYEMDKYIYPLRKIFPQVVDINAEDERAAQYVMQIINGEALLNSFINQWDYSESVSTWLTKHCLSLDWYQVFAKETNISNNAKHQQCLFKAIERLVDSYDALNDVLLAEGVHCLVQGDIDSYAAITQFMAEGKGNLPLPTVLDTPMEHVVFSNKVAIALPTNTSSSFKPMCLAEPAINTWLEQLMGSMQSIWFCIAQTKQDGSTSYNRCSLADVDILPIEYLYLSENEQSFYDYVETLWRIKHQNFTDKISVYPSWPKTEQEKDIDDVYLEDDDELNKFSLYENELRITQLRNMILMSHAMKANDIAVESNNDSDNEQAINLKDLKSRYISVRSYFTQLNNAMYQCLAKIRKLQVLDDAILAEMYTLLCECQAAGMTNAPSKFKPELSILLINPVTQKQEFHQNPILFRPNFDQALEAQQAFIESFLYAKQQIEERIKKAEHIVDLLSEKSYLSSDYIQAIQALLSTSFKVFPQFTLNNMVSEEQCVEYDVVIKAGIQYYDNLDANTFEEWQSDIADVREGMSHWHKISLFQSLCNGESARVSILQTRNSNDVSLKKWLGCKVDSEDDLTDVDSLVIYHSDKLERFASRQEELSYNAGIIIDSCLEYIPYKKQTAGMIFQCDQPDNEAPQSLLLALHPEFNLTDKKKPWDLVHILELLDSTRFMLMNRAVEPDNIYQDPYLSTLFSIIQSILLSGKIRKGVSSYSLRGNFQNEDFFLEDGNTIFNHMPGGHLLN